MVAGKKCAPCMAGLNNHARFDKVHFTYLNKHTLVCTLLPPVKVETVVITAGLMILVVISHGLPLSAEYVSNCC